MSRLKNDELRKVRATFDTFRSQCERQLVDLVEENERLREENGQLRLKMAQIERKGPDSGGRRPSRIRKNASASALLAKMPTTSDDEFSPGSPIKTLAKRNSRRRLDFGLESMQPITRLKRAYNGTSRTMSNIVTSTIRLGDLFLTDSELPIVETIGQHRDCITDIATKDEGGVIVTSSLDQTCRTWRREGLVDEINTYTGHCGAVNAVALNGELAASGSGDRQVHLWNTATCSPRATYHHAHVVESVSFVDSNILSGSWDGELKLFDIHHDHARTLLQTHAKISHCTIAPHDPHIALVSTYDGSVECIDNRGNESVKTRLLDENETHPGTTVDAKVNCAHFVADALIMSTANDKHVRIWDVRTNRILFKQQIADGLNKLTKLDADTVAIALDSKKMLVLKGLSALTTASVKLTKYAIPTPNVLALSPFEDDILAGGWSRELIRLSKQTIQV